MSVTVRIPAALRRLTGDIATVEARRGTITSVIEDLDRQYPGLREKLCDDEGALQRFFNVYVNGEDIRFLDGLQTELADGTELTIIPAVAGGAEI